MANCHDNSEMELEIMAAFEDKKNLKSINKSVAKTLFSPSIKSNQPKKLPIDITKNIDELKACFESQNNGESMLDKRINYIKEEVEIRIQSLHTELDEIQNIFFKKLDNLKSVSQNQLKRVVKRNRVEHLFESENVMDESNVSQFRMDGIKNQVEAMYHELLSTLSKITFEPCCDSINNNLIGKIESDDLLLGDEIKYRPYTKIDLNLQRNKPTAMCSINDELLLVTYNKENKILKLNAHFEKIEEITAVDRMKLNKPSVICTDESEHVYLLNENNSQVVIMDLDLKKITRVLKYTQYDFENIVSIAYCNNKLYILDTKVVHVFTAQGEFIKHIELNIDYASHLTVNENFIVIVDGNTKIHAYSHDGKFISTIETSNIGLINSISFINDYLFIHSNDGSFLCYTVNEKNFELSFSRGLNDLRESSTSMFYFDKHIYILLTFERTLIVF